MSEWISVKDRLPEQRRPVLVLAEGYMEVAVYRSPPNEFATHHGAYVRGATHWQPLPEPPTQ